MNSLGYLQQETIFTMFHSNERNDWVLNEDLGSINLQRNLCDQHKTIPGAFTTTETEGMGSGKRLTINIYGGGE